jgi:hypothetical protein
MSTDTRLYRQISFFVLFRGWAVLKDKPVATLQIYCIHFNMLKHANWKLSITQVQNF